MRFAIAAVLALGATATSLTTMTQTEADAFLDYDDLSPGQKAYVDQLYDETDVNNNDSIDYNEVDRLLVDYDIDLSAYPSWIRRLLFRRMDVDRNGSLDLEEALDALVRYAPEALEGRD